MISETLGGKTTAPRHCGFIRLYYHTFDLGKAAVTLLIKMESSFPVFIVPLQVQGIEPKKLPDIEIHKATS